MTDYPTVNRAELASALQATLPHVGKTRGAYVGLQAREGLLYVFASDDATLGVARLGIELNGHASLASWLPSAEARDLLRSVRTANQKQDQEPVTLLATGAELHVAVGEEQAVVYDALATAALTLDASMELLDKLQQKPPADPGYAWSFNPKYLERFAKAQRTDEVLRWTVHGVGGGVSAALLIEVGDHFRGAIMGIHRDYVPELAPWKEAA